VRRRAGSVSPGPGEDGRPVGAGAPVRDMPVAEPGGGGARERDSRVVRRPPSGGTGAPPPRSPRRSPSDARRACAPSGARSASARAWGGQPGVPGPGRLRARGAAERPVTAGGRSRTLSRARGPVHGLGQGRPGRLRPTGIHAAPPTRDADRVARCRGPNPARPRPAPPCGRLSASPACRAGVALRGHRT
jgi:hypothetical protein